MNIVAWIRPWDGDDSDLGNMLAEPVIDEDTTPPADNHQWFACVLHSDALAAIKQARREAEIATWAKAGAQRNLDVKQARQEERESCALAATAAGLPEGYRWGRDAMEQFDFGKKRAAAAIRARGEGK